MRFWQEVDGALVRLAASKADKVRDALSSSINAQQVADDFLRSHPADTKITSTQARDWARLHVTPKTLPLLSAIREAYAEAYALGQDAALAAYAHARLTKAADAQPSGDDLRASLQFDWSKWKAGNRPASLLLSPKNGLKGLLSNAGQTIKGMNDTSLNRVGTILGDALARGRGSDVAARTLITDGIDGMLTSASRAQTIAVTEMARATQIAQMDSYRDYGIEYVEWVDIDADDDCATNAEQGPIPLGQEFDSGDTEPPAHPNCRCAIVPAFPDDAELPPLADETTAEPEIETDHSDAIAQGLEAVATELHPDMAVATTDLADKVLGVQHKAIKPEVAIEPSVGVPSSLEVARALSRLEILPNPDDPTIPNLEKFVESPWQTLPTPSVNPNVWDNAEIALLPLADLFGTDPFLRRKTVRKHIEAMGQAMTPRRSYAMILNIGGKNLIIDGHHRLMALWLLGLDKAPVWLVKE